MEVIDVSRNVGVRTASWPGDREFTRQWTARLREEGSNVNLGAFCMSAHLGTHADAPFHFDPDGTRTDDFPLDVFCGPAQVVAVQDAAIGTEHVERLDIEAAPRVLFKTRASETPETEWSDAFPPILPATMRRLAEKGAVLVGTDAPSVDPVDSAELPAHHAMAQHGLFNLENLALAGVDPGRYTLYALPLRLEGMDAAPVRAALRPRPSLNRQ